MPIDYSKWKDIEVSDDEDDTHPNIDTPSLFRWRHQARLERMAEKKMAKEEVEKVKKESSTKMTELESKLKDASLSVDEKSKVEAQIAEIKKQEEEFLKKEQELADKERIEPWNVDTIGTVKMDKSRINKIGEKKVEKPTLSDEEDSKRMYEYFDKHESKMREFSRLQGGIEKSEEFLLEHPYLASDYAVNWVTIEALNSAIEEKEDDMKQCARQNIILQYLLELAKSLKADATNTNMIKNFFKKFKSADPQYMALYADEVRAFEERLRTRAQTKREAAMAEYEAEEKSKRVAAAPGGLDPQEVFESLPKEMRDAFESREVGRLQDIAQAMDSEVFSYHLQRCIDSGLWVPGGGADDDDEADEASAATSEEALDDGLKPGPSTA